MTDRMTPEQRHHCMASIRSKNTKPELIVRRFLHAHGFRYRIHVKKLPGTPDIVLPHYHTVVFVNGCFWHGHECSSYRKPKTHIKFWEEKINLNRKRDLRERLKLRSIGWHVIQLWECQLKPKVQKENLNSLLYTLNHITLLNYDAKEHTLYSVEETDKITENEIDYHKKK